MVDDYLQHLVEEGSLDSHGRITLDPSKARQKLAESRFVHAAEGLLALIGAALLAGSQRIQVAHAGSCWEFFWDGEPPTPTQLKDLFQNLFDTRQPLALRELGLAINSLYPKHCQAVRIEVESSLYGCFQGGEWRVDSQPCPPELPFRGRIIVVQTAAWRRPLQWLRSFWRGCDEMKILQTRTRWSPKPVLFKIRGKWVSSYQLDPPQRPPQALAEVYIASQKPELQLPEYSGDTPLFRFERSSRARSSLRCVLTAGHPAQCQLLLVYRGIALAQHQLNSHVFRFEGVLNTDSLDLDASRQHIVQNQRLRQRGETVRQWVLEGAVAWLQQLPAEPLAANHREFLQQAFQRLNNSRAFRTLVEAMSRFPLLPLCDGQHFVSLTDVRISLENFSDLHQASLSGPGYLHDRPLLLKDSEEMPTVRRLLKAQVVDADPWVRHWKAGGGALTLEPFQAAVYERFQLSGPEWQATLLLPQDFKSGSRLVMRRKGLPFHAHDKRLFADFPCNFQVFLDGDYAGSFNGALRDIQSQLRWQMAEHCEEWLGQMQRYAFQGERSKLHSEYYCSLLCLWISAGSDQRRRPPNTMLEYPVVSGAQILDLGWLLGDPGQLTLTLEDGHPAYTLARWLA
ncbi:hypothetical protein IV102_34695 [bacterium]|nr:hypothetical protein [bacterium]